MAGLDMRDIQERAKTAPYEVQHDVAALINRIEELEAAVREFLDFEDTHTEGPVVSDSYVTGPICADEDCSLYWPCPVEELRRAIGMDRHEHAFSIIVTDKARQCAVCGKLGASV